MTESMALVIQFILFGLTGLAALISGLVYVKTHGEHGGFIFLLFFILTFSLGGHIFDLTDAVLGNG